MKIGISEVLTAFNGDDVVGTKVLSGIGEFMHLLAAAINKDGGKAFESTEEKYRGMGFITMPSDAFHLVRCGAVSRAELSKTDKHIKCYRGVDEVFAHPRAVAPIKSLRVLVCLIDKYLKDPEVGEPEAETLTSEDVNATHVIVAIHAGPASFSSTRLVRNIAGGNQDYTLRTKLSITGDLEHGPGDVEHDVFLAHSMVGDAKETVEFERRWCVVADPTNYDN